MLIHDTGLSGTTTGAGHETYEIQKKLSEDGNYGDVYLCKAKGRASTYVVLKIAKKTDGMVSPSTAKEDLLNEARIQEYLANVYPQYFAKVYDLGHGSGDSVGDTILLVGSELSRHVVNLGEHNIHTDGDTFGFIMEFVDSKSSGSQLSTSLDGQLNYVKNVSRRIPTRITEFQRKIPSVLKGILKAVATMHEADVAHLDLKLNNLVSSESGIKIIDFGAAREQRKGDLLATAGIKSTPEYAAPELLSPQQYALPEGKFDGRAADMWSVGICLFYLVHFSLPFLPSGDIFDDEVRARMITAMEHLTASDHVSHKVHIPDYITKILEGLLKMKASERLTASQALNILNAEMNKGEMRS